MHSSQLKVPQTDYGKSIFMQGAWNESTHVSAHPLLANVYLLRLNAKQRGFFSQFTAQYFIYCSHLEPVSFIWFFPDTEFHGTERKKWPLRREFFLKSAFLQFCVTVPARIFPLISLTYHSENAFGTLFILFIAISPHYFVFLSSNIFVPRKRKLCFQICLPLSVKLRV